METLNNGTAAAAGDSATTSPSAPVLSAEHTTLLGWIDSDEASGAMSKEQAQQARREVTGEDIQPVKDARTPQEKLFDAQWPPAAPEAYNFPRYDDPENITKEMTAGDKMARNWLSTGLWPKEEGSYAAKECNRVAEEIEGFTDSQHELYQRTEMNKLTCIWREDTAKNIAIAVDYVRDLDKKTGGTLIPFLNSGVGNSSALTILIYSQAQRLAVRNGVKL
jgi:hypothetical protein